MPRRNGPGEARGPRAPRIPDRRRAQRRQTLPLDKGEPHERRRVLQADVLRNREPPLPPDDARSPATDAFGRPSTDATLRDRGSAERGDLPEARRGEVRSRVEQASRDTRPPPHFADPDRGPAHARGRLEPRLGGRVRGPGPTREADVHRMQRIQLRRREPVAASGGGRPQSRVHPDVRGTTRGSHRLSDRRGARGQPGCPAHPGRRAPSYFAMKESTAAAFITRIGYDAEGRGGPPSDPE